MYLTVSTSNPGTKSEIYGVMWQGAPESKIKLVSCKIYPLLVVSMLEDIHSIYAYIFCNSFRSVIFSNYLSLFVDLYAQVFDFSTFQWNILYEFSGFEKSVIQWSSDPNMKHVFGFRLLCLVRLFLVLHELKYEQNFLLNFPYLYFLKHF